MASITIQVTSNLAKLADGLDLVTRAGTLEAVQVGLEEAQRVVPVDTGELRDSLHIEVGTGGGDIVLELVAGTDHCVFVEFGTYKMAAQPYMTPASEAIARTLETAVAQKINALAGSL